MVIAYPRRKGPLKVAAALYSDPSQKCHQLVDRKCPWGRLVVLHGAFFVWHLEVDKVERFEEFRSRIMII
jgi:hypothetical protein